MIARYALLGLLACIGFILAPGASQADEAASLAGLKGFYVASLQSIVLPKAPESKADPGALKKIEDDAQSEMEGVMQGELRKAGIRVFTEEEFKGIPSVPKLELSETTLFDQYGTMHTALSLAVRQLVTIHVNQHPALATTWSRSRLVIIGKETQRTRGTASTVGEMLAELVNDYLQVNPKPSATSSQD